MTGAEIKLAASLLEIGVRAVKAWREKRGEPTEGPVTAEEVEAILIQTPADLIAQGRG